ncbi:MAG TPA: hypothetical protein VNL77_12645 [Roseiflexaceae bacterium]|nr:hypothetical protein [Roseiflexaceae bacterium]
MTPERVGVARGGLWLASTLMILALLLGACGQNTTETAPGEPTAVASAATPPAGDVAEDVESGQGVETGLPAGEEGTEVTVAGIMENPDAFVGQTVTISGDAQEMLGTHAFKLDEDDALSGGVDNDLLVIGATESEPAFDNSWLNQEVTVTGTIHMFDQAALEQELGYTLDPDLIATWDGKPVLVAMSVTPAQ